MPLALFALTISAFAIGTTEFVIVGLVPTIAQQLAISLPSAGMLVSIYALGVVDRTKLNRKTAQINPDAAVIIPDFSGKK